MREKITEILRRACALEEAVIGADTEIRDLSLDSLSFVVMLVELESEFGIEFEDEELNWENWARVGDLIARVEEKRRGEREKNGDAEAPGSRPAGSGNKEEE